MAVLRYCFVVILRFILCLQYSLTLNSYKPKIHENKHPSEKFKAEYSRHLKNSMLLFDEPGFDLTNEEKAKFKIWADGIIPYYIDVLSFDKVLRGRIRKYLTTTVRSVTGLIFDELPKPPANKKTRYVFFINRRGVLDCVDYNTKSFSNSGVQKVILGYDCISNNQGFPAIVLALAGVPPMHNAPDRDKYIDVLEQNIVPDKKSFFEVVGDDEWLFHDLDYDFSSTAHYHWHKYTANGKATIKPEKPNTIKVGERGPFSYFDVWKIRMLYNYIARKNAQNTNIGCKQLFSLGEEFDKIQRPFFNKNDFAPRPKPIKYIASMRNKALPTKAKERYFTSFSFKALTMKEIIAKTIDTKTTENPVFTKSDYENDVEPEAYYWINQKKKC